MNVDDLSDADMLDGTVSGITEALALTIAKAWTVSPRATLLAMGRALGALALRHLAAHPHDRANVLVMLRSLTDAVECETATKQ
jgi:hypothetical protein